MDATIIVFITIGFLLYFLPAIIAMANQRQVGAVIVVNLFLGWTFVGWIAALAMAVSDHSPSQQTVVIQQPPWPPPAPFYPPAPPLPPVSPPNWTLPPGSHPADRER